MVSDADAEVVERIKTLAYRYAQRHAYAAYTHEGAEFCKGGAEALYGGITDVVDVTRPMHEYWGDLVEATRALHDELTAAETERARLVDYNRQMLGALW